MQNTLYIPIEVTNNNPFECEKLVKRGDTVVLNIKVFSNGALTNLTGQSIDLILKKSDGTVIQKEIDITNVSGGVVTATLSIQATVIAGEVSGELQLSDSNGQNSTNTFTFNVSTSIADNVIEVSKNDINILNELRQLIANGEAVIAQYEEHILAIANTIEAIEALANIKSYIDTNLAALESNNAQAVVNINNLKTENDKAPTLTTSLKSQNDAATSNISTLTTKNQEAVANKNNIDSSISVANTSKIALDTSNTNATNTKNALDTLNTTATNTKNALNTVNQTGQVLLNSLEEFEQEHADVTDISNQLANVNTQLSEIVPNTTLWYLENIDNIRTRAIITVQGFYDIDEDLYGKYRVNMVDGTESWTIIDDGTTSFKISNSGEIAQNKDLTTSDKKLKHIAKHGEINVKLLGSKGDGVHDDTECLQKAINYCISKKYKLISDGNSIYLISNSLLVNTCNIDFNNATVKSNNNINLFEINTNDYYGHIENVIFDCTNADSGIMITNGRKKTFSNLIFNNISAYGFYYNAGYEILLDIAHFNGNGTAGTTGIYSKSSDSNFNNIILIDCFKAIVNKGLNYYNKIHAWIKTTSILEGSTMFDLIGNIAYCSNCYSDTYYKTFNKNGGNVIANKIKVFFNQDIYSEEITNPYVFYFVSDSDNSNRSTLTDSDINGVRGTQSILFSNSNNPKIKVNNNNLVWVSNYKGGTIISQTTNNSAIIEILVNETVVKNGFVSINLVFRIDTSISSSFSFNNLDVSYKPRTPFNSFCAVGTTQWNVSEVGYLFIQDNVAGSVPDNDTIKFVKINVTYPITNENY